MSASLKKSFLVLLLAFCPWQGPLAYTNFVQNPYTPYPMACDWTSGWSEYAWYNSDGDSKRYKFHEGEISLLRPDLSGDRATARVKAYRIVCPETNRSQILLQFTSPQDKSGFYATPSIRAVTNNGRSSLMSLSPVQGSWNLGDWPASGPERFGNSNCEGNNHLCSMVGWTFVLDNKSPFIPGATAGEFMTADEYNSSFRLELNWAGNSAGYVIEVPATRQDFHESAEVPLTGRHSGLWVIDGASDQGFNIAVSESMADGRRWMYEWPYAVPMVLFLSWYTFDADGRPLWLTGSATFKYGESPAAFQLISVSGGEFLGEKAAERKVAGQVRITANNCNDLGIEYDLNPIDLGAGTAHLQRKFSLEIAGHTCRDLQARISANR